MFTGTSKCRVGSGSMCVLLALLLCSVIQRWHGVGFTAMCTQCARSAHTVRTQCTRSAHAVQTLCQSTATSATTPQSPDCGWVHPLLLNPWFHRKEAHTNEEREKMFPFLPARHLGGLGWVKNGEKTRFESMGQPGVLHCFVTGITTPSPMCESCLPHFGPSFAVKYFWQRPVVDFCASGRMRPKP